MNHSNRKFRNTLKRIYKEKLENLNIEFETYLCDKLSKDRRIIRYEEIKYKSDMLKRGHAEHLRRIKAKWRYIFENLNSQKFAELCELEEVISCYNKDNYPYFNKFDVLDNYFNLFSCTEEEKGEILAYFLNLNILHYQNFRYSGNEEKTKILVEQSLKNIKMSKRKKKQEIERRCVDFDANQERKYNEYSILRVLINETGKLQPLLNAFAYEDLFSKLEDSLSYKQFIIILNTSKNKATKMLEENSRAKAPKKDKTSIPQIIQNISKPELNKQANKLQRIAFQKLVNYLDGDYPICYIKDEEIGEVIALLKQAGYTLEQILIIKKAIYENNLKILESKQQEKINLAINTYLCKEEIEVLEAARSLLFDTNAIANPIYQRINSNYKLVIEQLTLIAEVTDINNPIHNYEIEILIIGIAEIKDLIVAYNKSDYRRVLAKKD